MIDKFNFEILFVWYRDCILGSFYFLTDKLCNSHCCRDSGIHLFAYLICLVLYTKFYVNKTNKLGKPIDLRVLIPQWAPFGYHSYCLVFGFVYEFMCENLCNVCFAMGYVSFHMEQQSTTLKPIFGFNYILIRIWAVLLQIMVYLLGQTYSDLVGLLKFVVKLINTTLDIFIFCR